jgi:hypothetical protein
VVWCVSGLASFSQFDLQGVLENFNINPPLGKSDHSVIEMECNLRSISDNKKKTRYKYDKGDYSKLAELFDVSKNQVYHTWIIRSPTSSRVYYMLV